MILYVGLLYNKEILGFQSEIQYYTVRFLRCTASYCNKIITHKNVDILWHLCISESMHWWSNLSSWTI